MIIVWFYKKTMSETLQSLYITDMSMFEIRKAFEEYGEDGGPFFMQDEHLTDKFLQPIVDSDVDGDEVTENIINFFRSCNYINNKVDMSGDEIEYTLYINN